MDQQDPQRRKLSDQHSDVDRISDLPGTVLDNILMRLPLRDTVRTSVLSQKWKRRWADVPQLVFDSTFLSYAQKRQAPKNYESTDLMLSIYEVSSLHSGPIHKFHLSVPELKPSPHLNRLLLFLSWKGIQLQDFKLCLSHLNRDGFYHTLPSCLFSFLQLRSLTLNFCVVRRSPPTFEGFSMLTILKFKKVVVPLNFNEFISNCLLLEELVLDSCSFLGTNSNSLSFEINAPNLKLLYFVGSLPSLHLKNVTHLAIVSIYASLNAYYRCNRKPECQLIEILSRMPAVKQLKVDYHFLQCLIVSDESKRLPTPLGQLKILVLYKLWFAEVEVISSIIGLLRSSPNLQKLQIQVDTSGKRGGDINASLEYLKLLETEDPSEFSLSQLHEVKLQMISATGPDLSFVKFLLAKSPALRKMYVQAKAMSADEQVKILTEMIRFHRASPYVDILWGTCSLELQDDYVHEWLMYQ